MAVTLWRYRWDSVPIPCLFSTSYPEYSCLFINKLTDASWRYEEAYTAWYKKKVHWHFRWVFQMYSRVKKKERLRNKQQNLLQPEDKISLKSRTKPGNVKSWVPAVMGRRGGLCDETAILSSKGVKNSSSRQFFRWELKRVIVSVGTEPWSHREPQRWISQLKCREKKKKIVQGHMAYKY